MLSALVVDDEPLARTRLRRLLESLDVHIVGESEDAAEGLRLAGELQPDVVFLDIKMPELTGLQVATALARVELAPVVVFVTGYSDFAVDAFEQNAIDYLLKPITLERLTVTLARVTERIAFKVAIMRPATESVSASGLVPMRSLPVKADYAVRFIPLEQIICAISCKRQIHIITKDSDAMTFYSLSQLERLLPTEVFLRIHDSAIVNVDAIVELLFLGDHAYEVRMSNGQLLRIGRSRYPELRRRMGLATLARSQ